MLEEMKKWLNKNINKKNKEQYNVYINDIDKTLETYENEFEFDGKIQALVMGNMKNNAFDYDNYNCKCNCNQEYYKNNCEELFNKEDLIY